MFGLGLPELVIVLAVALLVFGPARLPSVGKSVGEALKGFKKGLADDPQEERKEVENGKCEEKR